MPVNSPQIRIGEYVDIFFYRKWLFIIPFVIVTIAAITATFFLPEIYRATVKIEVIGSPLVTTYDISDGVKQQFDILRERTLSQSVLKGVIDELQQDALDEGSIVEESIASLSSNTTITMIGKEMIKVSYDGSDRQRASKIVKILANAFIGQSFKKREEEESSAVDFIGSELGYYRNKIDRKEDGAGQTNPIAKRLQTKLRILEDRLADLLIDSRDDHPTVIDLKASIADTIRELEIMDVDTDVIGGGVGTERETRLDEALYIELLSKLEMVRISQRLKREEERTKFKIMDLDRIMVYKVAPNKKKIAVSGIVFGILLGIGLISLVEFIDHSFKGLEDARTFLALPTLGSLPEIRSVNRLRES